MKKYSTLELLEFKAIIVDKLNKATEQYNLLIDSVSGKDNNGTDDTSWTFKMLEDGQDVLSKDETMLLAQKQEKFIISLKNALTRIENKTYGICSLSGQIIPKERLLAVPNTTVCINQKSKF